MKKMKQLLILVALIVFMVVSGAWMVYGQETVTTDICTTVIIEPSFVRCVDGYEWMFKYERVGCQTHAVPVSQKFEIYPKRSGKPKMMLPVPCNELEPIPVP